MLNPTYINYKKAALHMRKSDLSIYCSFGKRPTRVFSFCLRRALEYDALPSGAFGLWHSIFTRSGYDAFAFGCAWTMALYLHTLGICCFCPRASMLYVVFSSAFL